MVLPHLALSTLLHPHSPARPLRSADELLLQVPRSKQKLRGDRAVSVAVLPLHARWATSLTLKLILKPS